MKNQRQVPRENSNLNAASQLRRNAKSATISDLPPPSQPKPPAKSAISAHLEAETPPATAQPFTIVYPGSFLGKVQWEEGRLIEHVLWRLRQVGAWNWAAVIEECSSEEFRPRLPHDFAATALMEMVLVAERAYDDFVECAESEPDALANFNCAGLVLYGDLTYRDLMTHFCDCLKRCEGAILPYLHHYPMDYVVPGLDAESKKLMMAEVMVVVDMWLERVFGEGDETYFGDTANTGRALDVFRRVQTTYYHEAFKSKVRKETGVILGSRGREDCGHTEGAKYPEFSRRDPNAENGEGESHFSDGPRLASEPA